MVRRRYLELRCDAELLKEVNDGLADTLYDEFDIGISDVVCRGDDDVVTTGAINGTGAWVRVHIVSILQSCTDGQR